MNKQDKHDIMSEFNEMKQTNDLLSDHFCKMIHLCEINIKTQILKTQLNIFIMFLIMALLLVLTIFGSLR